MTLREVEQQINNYIDEAFEDSVSGKVVTVDGYKTENKHFLATVYLTYSSGSTGILSRLMPNEYSYVLLRMNQENLDIVGKFETKGWRGKYGTDFEEAKSQLQDARAKYMEKIAADDANDSEAHEAGKNSNMTDLQEPKEINIRHQGEGDIVTGEDNSMEDFVMKGSEVETGCESGNTNLDRADFSESEYIASVADNLRTNAKQTSSASECVKYLNELRDALVESDLEGVVYEDVMDKIDKLVERVDSEGFPDEFDETRVRQIEDVAHRIERMCQRQS